MSAATLSPLELLSAEKWERATFTTYALSLSFVEAVLLDRLVRQGSAPPMILSDVEGVRDALSELGAQRIGRNYDVEPVRATSGVFHPKAVVLASSDDCHAIVGSGNLTFSGWGRNCEVVEHLHGSFAADAMVDLAQFFDHMAGSSRVQHAAGATCHQVAIDLRSAANGKTRDGAIRVLHNFNKSIAEQISDFASDLGGATRLTAVAPFWDKRSSAIDSLASSLGLSHVDVHSHEPGCVRGNHGSNWPKSSKMIRPVRLETLETDGRPLHAKMFEVMCRRGRLLVSGSANASRAALGANQNIELCVARIQRRPSVGWVSKPSQAPDVFETESEAEPESDRSGVLRASLDGSTLEGMVLTPKMSGDVNVDLVRTTTVRRLGRTGISAGGSFRMSAPDLEKETWRPGHMIVRLSDESGRRAEGFVSVEGYAEITKRAGKISRQLFAILSGTETPADIAGMLSWFHENPDRLQMGMPAGGGGKEDSPKERDRPVVIPVVALDLPPASITAGRRTGFGQGERQWTQFIGHVLAAFREHRGSVQGSRESGGETPSDEEAIDAEVAQKDSRDTYAAFESFEALLDVAVSESKSSHPLLVVLDLAQYLIDRLEPDPATALRWLKRVTGALLKVDLPEKRRRDILGSVMTIVMSSNNPGSLRWGREAAIRLNADLSGDGADQFEVSTIEVLPAKTTAAEAWSGIKSVRTFPEQVRNLLNAIDDGSANDGYPDLPEALGSDWAAFSSAVTSASARKSLLLTDAPTITCPACDIRLAPAEDARMRSIGVARAGNCCRRFIVVRD